MYKFLIIAGLILYVLYKIGTFFFRAGAATQQLKNQQRQNRQEFDSNPRPKNKNNNVKGGEYVDYEEIK